MTRSQDSGSGGDLTGTLRSEITIVEATSVSDELVEALGRLVPQLSASSPPPTRAELEEIVGSAASVLLVARNAGGTIVGSMTLAMFRLPTGVRAWIEDVVVDAEDRGSGTGGALVMAAVRRALEAGAKSVDLTSRPDRQAANRLYRRLGFEERETNVYRFRREA